MSSNINTKVIFSRKQQDKKICFRMIFGLYYAKTSWLRAEAVEAFQMRDARSLG